MAPGNSEGTGIDGRNATRDCAAMRHVLERIGSKWTLIVVSVLHHGPRRFNQLRRELDGVSQRMLTLTLRNLERDGLISRTVFASVPPQVEYALTGLGQSLYGAAEGLLDWADAHSPEMDQARAAFDAGA
ncbi:putative HxlR family transcriptional regulator [Caenibius tardaugens NBRC 16725]|uniref:Putative HxlR family transcriptional regulator n=1 Tax=Caenibius tardaugens NBRC 16725 TaxID=1219035 RepID=U2YAC2_9SPHN|nr:helix-turn-helix domain-containing protein [Caenibius tardaugens]AZI35123.1 transcriptional regulator [Caenibius tardaugens NBRC 16725]TXG98283.1 MAG: transcriptional regulator [Rhodocyclaceae bacterium]GAD50316.1 putative HxlR family transcriptional regulator [Caenibius tardaugens NBRC 16725]